MADEATGPAQTSPRVTGPSSATAAQSVGAAGPTADGELLALAGLAAYTRLRQFSQVAAHVWGAPTLDQQQRLLRRAMRIGRQQEELLAIGASHGLNAEEEMSPVKGIYDSFVARTAPASWWEGLLRPAVTHGITRDLVLLLAGGLPEAQAAEIRRIMADDDPDDGIGWEIIRDGVATNQVLNSRLSLWGRRVAGEALQICASVVNSNPQLAALALRAAAAAPIGADGVAPGNSLPDAIRWLQGELTARHAKRMEAITLIP